MKESALESVLTDIYGGIKVTAPVEAHAESPLLPTISGMTNTGDGARHSDLREQ